MQRTSDFRQDRCADLPLTMRGQLGRPAGRCVVLWVQIAACHADPRTAMRYDRAR